MKPHYVAFARLLVARCVGLRVMRTKTSVRMQVDVYYNVTKKCLSVRYKGKVIDHVPVVRLLNAKFIVSEPGRKRVLDQKRKNVHAVVRGEMALEKWSFDFAKAIEATYNPYKYSTFVERGTERAITEAKDVFINHRSIYVIE